ncbi:MAG TPA: SMP-30/gluconolactonase/LRE family protein [Chloroflexota bacterium]|nr:SMP-30/gluconolactonase/LRE family protein [Chloroflexota bacterium]
MAPVIPIERSSVFFDGLFSEPRLNHPEGIAVDRDGNVWCGGEEGEIYRIAADGSRIELMASTGGFTLGLEFDQHGRLYSCDLKHAAVYRFDPASGSLEQFAAGDGSARMRVPNVPVVDVQRNCLYVSDSYHFQEAGPGVWRFDLDSGAGTLWYDRPLRFANGMALSADRGSLYVAETFARRVVRIPIGADGAAGDAEVFVQDVPALPDGLAFDVDGRLYVACYEPSRIYRADAHGRLELLIDDPEAHTLCHPTNCAFRGTELFNSNLGRWHITRTEVGAEGLPLP